MSINSKMTAIADKIRALLGVSGMMGLDSMASNLQTATDQVDTQTTLIAQIAAAIVGRATGFDTSDATITEASMLEGEVGYGVSGRVVGNIKSQPAMTITPGVTQQKIQSGVYLSGDITVPGDANLIPGNIKSGETIFGIPGTYEGEGAVVRTASVTPSSNSRSIAFTGLPSQPKMFCVVPLGNTALSSTTRYALNVAYDGSTTRGIYSNNSTATHTTNGFTWTFSNGTLTINTASTSNGGYFKSNTQYQLIYVA